MISPTKRKLLAKALIFPDSRFLSTIRATSSVKQASTYKYDAPWLDFSSEEEVPVVKNFINGQFTTPSPSSSSKTIPLYDPSTNKLLSNVVTCLSSLESAVSSANDAYSSWSNTPVQIRQRFLLEYANFLHGKEVRKEIAYWITLEQVCVEDVVMC